MSSIPLSSPPLSESPKSKRSQNKRFNGSRWLMLAAMSLSLTLGHITASRAALGTVQAPLAWGINSGGELGNGGGPDSSVPVKVNTAGALAGKTITQLATGNSHALALCSDGTLVAWGSNGSGGLGTENGWGSYVPVSINNSGVLAGKTVTQIAAGGESSLALCSDGTLAAWGNNDSGRLGDGTTENRFQPVNITESGILAGKTVTQIAVGNEFSVVLCSDGTLASWGRNADGVLGNGTTNSSSVPGPVTQSGVLAGKTITKIFSGGYRSLVMCADGTLAAWGGNHGGALGDGTSTQRNAPVDITGKGALAGKTVVQMASGLFHSLAVCSDGTVATWGQNSFGQLGNGTTNNSALPTAITGNGALAGKTVTQVSAGYFHTLAICDDGTAAAWGANFMGQLGDGTTNNSALPVAVLSSGAFAGKKASIASLGAYHNVVLSDFVPSTTAITGSSSAVTSRGATLSATVNPGGAATTAKIEYGTSEDYGSEAPLTLTPNDGTTDQAVSAVLTGLSPHTLYFFRVSATNSAGTVTGTNSAFLTSNTQPIRTNRGQTLNERTSATIPSANLRATDADDDTLTYTITAAPTQGTLFLDNVALALNDSFTVADIAAGKLSYTHTGAGNDSFDFSLSDGVSSTTDTFNITITPVPPTVSSVSRVAGATNPTNATSLVFTVVFSEAVTGVDASDFSLTTIGLSTASLSQVTGSGTTYTVTVNGVTGQGTLRLDVLDDNTIQDVTGNPLDGGFTAGQSYNIDTLAPSATLNQASTQSDPATSGPIHFTLTFSEPINDLANADIQVGGTAGATTAQVFGVSPGVYRVEVSGMTRTGTVTASLPAGVVTDALGNLNTASTSTDNTVAYGQAPTTLALSRTLVQEKQPAGTFVGLLSTTDADTGDNFTYSLVGGDTTDFAISGAQLRTNASFDVAVKSSYALTIRTTDSAGLFVEAPFTITVLETGKPVVTISSPTTNQKVLISALTGDILSGAATDNVGVVAVKARLSRKVGTTNEYWNGTAFGPTQAWLSATVNAVTVDTVGGPNVTWTLDGQLPAADKLQVGAYALQVYALDAANNKSAYANGTFNIVSDLVAPTLSISTPTTSQKLLISDFNGSAVGGSVNDDLGVASVRVRLSRKRGTTNEYWNGTDFVTSSAYVDATINGTSWSLGAKTPAAEKLDSGAYLVEAYALDNGGNKSATSKVSFSLSTDYSAPSVAISTPTSSKVVKIGEFGAGVITGTATDNIGVTSVKLKLQRKRGTSYEYWNGTAFTPTSVLFDATYNSESGAWSYDTAIPASALDAGGYTVYATSFDAAGNKTTSASRTFSIVGTPSASDALSAPAAKSAGSS